MSRKVEYIHVSTHMHKHIYTAYNVHLSTILSYFNPSDVSDVVSTDVNIGEVRERRGGER